MSPWDDSRRIDEFLRGIGQWLLFFLVLFLLVGGVQIVTNPAQEGGWYLAGWGFLVVSVPVTILTIGRWVKLLPALFAYSALRIGFLSFDGHSANNPLPASRLEYVVVYLIVIASVALSIRYARKNYTLTLVDRLCLLATVALVMLETGRQSAQSRHVGHSVNYYDDFALTFAAALGCLLIAWSYNRFRHHSRSAHKNLQEHREHEVAK